MQLDYYVDTLMSSSCISRNSNFLLLSETESSEGRPVPTVSTTSSGKDESVATTASCGLILPDTVKALENLQKLSGTSYCSCSSFTNGK